LMLEIEPANRPGLTTLAQTAEHVLLDAAVVVAA